MSSLRTPFLVSFLCLSACSSSNEPVKVDPSTQPSSNAASKAMDPSKMPANHPPLANQNASSMPKPPDNAGALKFAAPEGWTSETPTVMFRREQYRLAHQGTDTDDALVIVSYLGSAAGTVESNKIRWAGQFTQPDGKSSMEVAKMTERMLGTTKVIDFEVSGTMNADQMGGDPKTPKPGWRMIVGWLQAADGQYFVKLLGPQGTVAHWEPAFRKFVDSAK